MVVPALMKVNSADENPLLYEYVLDSENPDVVI